MFKRSVLLLLLIASTLLFAGCFIEGDITDEYGVGIGGVTVTLGGDQIRVVTTRAGDGKYRFGNLFRPDTWVPVGNYTVTPSKSGCIFSPVSATDVTVSMITLQGTGEDVPWPAIGVDFVFMVTTENTYCVGKNGSDSNPGTLDAPWRTIQHAANTMVAGDTVYIKAGTYQEKVIPMNSGTAGNYITYSAYPGDMVIIDGSNISLGQFDALFNIAGKQYIKVSGLKVINAGPFGTSAGIQADNTSYITIEKNYTYNTASSGILVWGSSNVIIDGNEVVLANNKGADSQNECITVGETDNFEVKNNHVHDGFHVRGEGVALKDGSSNGKAYANHVHHIPDVGIYIDAQARHTYNIDVYQNTVHNIIGEGEGIVIASEAGGLLENIRVYNNIVYNNDISGIGLSYCCMDLSSTHPVKDIKIINNTLYNNGILWGGGIYHDNPEAQNVVIRNNIVSENLSFQIAINSSINPANLTVDHNLIDGYRGNSDDCETRGNDYVEGSPVFTDVSNADFHIGASSPATDAGSSIDAPADDFEGNSRPQGTGYDIGAYEY